MVTSLRKILGLDESSEYVVAQLERTNRDVLRHESVFIATISFLVLVSTFFPIVPWEGKPEAATMLYRVGMALVCTLSIACHIACTKLTKKDAESINATRLILILYTTILLVIAVVLTLFDYANTESFFVYIVTLVFIFGLLYIQPMAAIGINVLYAGVLVGALTAMGYRNPAAYLSLLAYAFLIIVVSVSNYHTRKRMTTASEMVRSISLHDPLTGTKNRRAIAEDVHRGLNRKSYLLLGDIDDFKFFNDSFGHSAGDEMLRAFADSMCQAFGHDNVYRYGGDEFIAVAIDVEDEEFHEMTKTWRTVFSNVKVSDKRYVPTVSGGYVSGTPKTVEEVQEMLRLADVRLFDAKQAGRNKVLGMVYEGSQSAGSLLDADRLDALRSGEADPLTNLPTMTYFTVHARVLLNSPSLADSTFYLVYFNIENMKAYNERFGMDQGDALIVLVGKTIREAFPRALAARMGDDRFVLLTYNTEPFEGIEHVHEVVRTHNSESNTIIRAGVYEYEPDVELSAACDRAKLACDHIKGRHNVYHFVYNEKLHEVIERKQFILDRFEEAIANGYIQAYYQPIIRSVSGRVSEFEALARWIDPVDGLIPPCDFIPVIEEYRLVHKLDLQIIECVCRDIRALSDEGLRPLPVNVNLSRFDLGLCDIVEETASIMRRYDVPANMLNIEITETAFSDNTELLRATIERFHNLGVQVWMDDFGSGYSSLNVLREFDFDVVKFDMLFLRHRNETSRERSHMMLPHLVNMAKELGIQTLTEGVETEEQYQFLHEIGCEKVQGFAFGKPMPPEQGRAMLSKGDLGAETPHERRYYNPIGKVNLAMPVAIDPELAHSIELSNGMPAAIVEFRDGRVNYLHWNSSYIDYLKDIGMNTIENSVTQMNDLSRPQSQGFFKAAEYLRGKQEWLNLSFYEGDDLCTGMARCVSVDDETGATAFVYIAFNVTRYLARVGLSMPEQHATR